MTEQELLIDCLRRLNAAQIPYMVAGSMASNFWGVPRSTHDIDFVVQFELPDVTKFVSAFEEQFFIQEHSVRAALRPPYQFNALDNRSALKVDFFSAPHDEYDRVRFQRRYYTTIWRGSVHRSTRGCDPVQTTLALYFSVGSPANRFGGDSCSFQIND